MDRRRFLKLSSFFSVSPLSAGLSAGLSACSGDDPATPEASGANWKFPQSVASADPRPDSIVLWTRVSPSGVDDTASLQGGTDVTIRLVVTAADNSALLGSDTALSGTALANLSVPAYADYDGTIRHKLTGLSPATTYYYQFTAGTVRSKVGRFKTAPASSAALDQLRFAFITCQDWSINHWAGYEHLVAHESDLDFFLHLGDYIYETVGADFQTGLVESRHGALSLPEGASKADGSSGKYANALDDYRYLYKRYRSDSRIQALHERFAMIAIWDDHEFSDDCWQDAETYDLGSYDATTGAADNTHQTSRRLHANRAWFEFMPADVSYDANSSSIDAIQIYRKFQFGSLAQLAMTDERLYRADHTIPEAAVGSSIGSRYMVPAATIAAATSAKIAAATAAGAADPLAPVSMLGSTQRAWWEDAMKSATTTWKLWGNEVSLLRMGLNGTDAIATLVALNAIGTLATQIGTAASSAGSVTVAAALVAAMTAGASQTTATNAAVAIATADATSADLAAAAVGAGLSSTQAGIAVAAYSAAKAAAAAGSTAQAGAAAQVIAFGLIKTDIQANGASSSFITAADPNGTLTAYFQKFLLNCDQWDGYNAERQALMGFLRDHAVQNVVALTGDIHAFFAGTVRDDYDAATGQDVMVDLVTAGMSSDSFFSYLSSAVGDLSAELATLVVYTLSIPTAAGTLSVPFNLLDYTLGKATPTLDSLAEQARVRVRGALAQAGVAEAALDGTTDTVLAGLKADSGFNTTLLGLAQQLAGLNSNPWLKHVNTDAQGYSVVTLTAQQLSCEFRQVNRLVGSNAPATSVIARSTTAVVTAGTAAVTVS
ncbi:phosphodiesterase [Ideonella dechloratans]|uniref:Phosphodiesterase n=1 Tax=Ideonella dechloratans TaxID=36863 RepID=A0A643F6D2_IDEDE|nr:alkaline phosphatase D family protein [Ideonella dechloratans]KAB0573902.1 phosphodiesterase [Ideonella dechloratans]UFU11286.1 alkaline phosphatase D family protein [Ideonella dechloratans]